MSADLDLAALRRKLDETDAHGVVVFKGDLRALLDRVERAEAALDDSNRMAAEMLVSLDLSPCSCSVSVQPPHARKCNRCIGIEAFRRHRRLKEARDGEA